MDGYDVGISGLNAWGTWQLQVREGEDEEWFSPYHLNGYLVPLSITYKSLVAVDTFFRSRRNRMRPAISNSGRRTRMGMPIPKFIPGCCMEA